MQRLRPPYQYIVDTSALIDLKDNYPEEVFPGIWERFNYMFGEKLIVAPREVYREIKRGNDNLAEWAETWIDNFLEPTNEEVDIMQKEIMNLYTPKWREKYSTGCWADPLVLAAAKFYRIPLIQHEKATDPAQLKIPNLAIRLGVQCNTLIQFFVNENWRFTSSN